MENIQIQNQRQTDLVNALNAMSTLVDIAKRDPLVLLVAGLILVFVALIGVL
ncbi:MAG: hypothetical protein AB1608_07200 [Thermoproteota archaeon]